MQTEFTKLCQAYGLDCTTTFANAMATEMVRYGAAQVHNVAAIVGGVASQEAVKVITGQYTPMAGTYVYNGIASIGGVYQF